jgi:hypothetical protein
MTFLRDLPATITVTDAADILGISRRLLVPTARLLHLLGHHTDDPPNTDQSS